MRDEERCWRATALDCQYTTLRQRVWPLDIGAKQTNFHTKETTHAAH